MLASITLESIDVSRYLLDASGFEDDKQLARGYNSITEL